MNIRLKHPVHGTKIANSVWELNSDKANGWYECKDHLIEKQPQEVTHVVEKPVINNLIKKRGRPSK